MSGPASQDSYPYPNEPTWSKSEKAIAGAAFDAPLGRALHEVIQEAKRMANQIQKSSDLCDLEHCLTRRRKEIDYKYDNPYSHLTQVLGKLLYERRHREEELRGLGETTKVDPLFREILGAGHSSLNLRGRHRVRLERSMSTIA